MISVLLAAVTATVPATLLITPGRGIGNTWIGDSETRLTTHLGRPSYGEAAMGHFWATWAKNGEVLDIYTERAPDIPKVRIIRITSPAFQTSNGVRTGTVKSRVLRMFPAAREFKKLQIPGNHAVTELYESSKQGIAFEFRDNRLVGIAVHPVNHNVDKYYSPMSQYLLARNSVRRTDR